MIQKFAFSLLALGLLFISGLARAGNAEDAKASLTKAREGVLALLSATDDAARKGLEAKIAEASQGVDKAVDAALIDKATPSDQVTKYGQFKTVWEQFKKTRDAELIPAIHAGKLEEAKSIAKGVQAERYKKMNGILAELGAK